MKPTVVIAIDFDGVLHDYYGTMSHLDLGDPIPGAIEWFHKLRQDYVVAIYSCRSASSEGREMMRGWLKRWLPMGDLFNVYLPEHKPYAALYVDDKGFRFNGVDFPDIEEILKDEGGQGLVHSEDSERAKEGEAEVYGRDSCVRVSGVSGGGKGRASIETLGRRFEKIGGDV